MFRKSRKSIFNTNLFKIILEIDKYFTFNYSKTVKGVVLILEVHHHQNLIIITMPTNNLSLVIIANQKPKTLWVKCQFITCFQNNEDIYHSPL